MNPQRWMPFLATVFLLGLLLKVPMLSMLTSALAVVIAVANWWRKRALDNVVYTRQFHYTRAFPGEEVEVRLEVENRKFLPISWLRVLDTWPKAVGPVDENILVPSHHQNIGLLTNIFSLRWFERTRRFYNLKFRERGVHTVGPARLESGDLFGIYSEVKEVGSLDRLTVFPKLVSLEELDLPAENPFGDIRSRRRLFEDPNRPMGVREYRPEDEFRRVHWPATARTGDIQVKVYQPTSTQVLMACMNSSTFPRHWEGVYPELLEYLIRVTASLLNLGMQNGYQVGLISNGTLANSDQPFRISPGRSQQHLAHILQALAGVTPLVTAPFERFLLREVPRVPFGSTLVIISAVITPALNETFVRVKKHGRRIVLISLSKEIPLEIPGIQTLHMPFKEELVHNGDFQKA